MVNALTTLRADVAEILSDAGIKAIHYQENRITPPCAIVIPDDNYVSFREGDRFGYINVALQVLLLGPRTTERTGAEMFDGMILTALKALGDEFDIATVQAPSEVMINEVEYFAVVITLEVQIQLGKDN